MIFVTGGTGLVGAHLLLELCKEGKKVKALKRENSKLETVQQIFETYTGNARELFGSIEWVNGDILDYFALEKLLIGISEIYHCAAIVSFDKKDRAKMISNNVEGTANLVDAAIENGVKKICHVSSIAALGRLQNGQLVTEETNWIPTKKHSAYSESKFFSEVEIWRGVEEGLDAVIVNPSIILGAGNWDSSSPRMFKTVFEGLKFYTRGITGYVDVQDVVKAMVLLMDEKQFESCKNQRYLLNAENLSYEDVFNQIADALSKPRPSIFASKLMTGFAWRFSELGGWITGKTPTITRDVAASSRDVNRFDGAKITRTLDFSYTPISETIERTAKVFLENIT